MVRFFPFLLFFFYFFLILLFYPWLAVSKLSATGHALHGHTFFLSPFSMFFFSHITFSWCWWYFSMITFCASLPLVPRYLLRVRAWRFLVLPESFPFSNSNPANPGLHSFPPRGDCSPNAQPPLGSWCITTVTQYTNAILLTIKSTLMSSYTWTSSLIYRFRNRRGTCFYELYGYPWTFIATHTNIIQYTEYT